MPARIASAAASDEVSVSTCSGASPPAVASHAWRWRSARVLPVPAAPTTTSGPPRWGQVLSVAKKPLSVWYSAMVRPAA